MTTNSAVWDRTSSGGYGELSRNAFAALVSFWTVAGLALSAFVAHHTPASLAQEHPWALSPWAASSPVSSAS